MVGPCAKREAHAYLAEKYDCSTRQICRTLSLYRSTQRNIPVKDDSEVEEKLLALAAKYPRRGMDWYYLKIRQQGLVWNRKRIIRVYRKLNLKMRRKHKKRINRPYIQGVAQPLYPNISWSMDFMSDALENGRKIRVLNIIDDFNRECLRIEIGVSLCAHRVTRALDWIIELRGKPMQIRTDNGPEFTSNHYKYWCEEKRIEPIFIQPGKPYQNGLVERFNRTYREDILDAYLFNSTQQVQIISDKWQNEYNYGHPHQSLQGKSPMEFKYSRRKAIDAYETVKAKMNGSIEPALTVSPSSINAPLCDYLKGII